MPSACGSACGSWNFESGPGSTEGWEVIQPPAMDVAMSINGAQSVAISSTNPEDGSYSLAVEVDINSTDTFRASAGVEMCPGNATYLGGYHVRGSVYLDGSAMTTGTDLSLQGWGPPTDYTIDDYPILTDIVPVNQWIDFNVTLTDLIEIDHIGIKIEAAGEWTGTMYLDNVRFSST